MGRTASSHESRAEHVIVVSIDGLKPEIYLEDGWPAPALRSLMWRGAHAEAVTGIFPSLTYPSHTTMATGALPARHGVWSNQTIEPSDDAGWLKDASLIRVPALWDAVRAAGGTTAALNWPLTVGAAIDWNVPDVWPGSDAEVVRAMAEASQPRGLLPELEREATGRLHIDNFSSRLLAHDVRLAAMATYLFDRYRPNLMLVHVEGVVQILQEPDWRNPRRLQAIACADVVVALLAELLDRTGAWDHTTLIATGDHGMTEVHTQVRPNAWLAEAGLRPIRLDGGDDWRAMFHALGGCALLRVQEPVAENVGEVRRVLERLDAPLRETFRIVEREELDALGSDPEAPFVLAAAPGFVLDQRADPPDTRPNPGMSHGHHPELRDMDTGLVAAGAGIRPGAAAPRMRLTDLAPLAATLLGVELEAPDGAAWPGLLEE
ncbi:MAG TPA: ectonucleotide pyrophosphatase/phosphodiesterase [Longimicrobiales bacterium]